MLSPGDETAVRVEDVLVSRRRLRDEAQVFVDEVAAPPPGQGLARWRNSLCIGTANINGEVAQPLIDHIYQVAVGYGLRAERPGCTPDVVIFFTEDGPGFASALVSAKSSVFDLGWSPKINRGRKALRAFQASDAPVRWWQVSVPIEGFSGLPAIRMPGSAGGGPLLVGEGIVNRGRQIADSLTHVVIVVDVAKIEGVMLPQLGDYLAMVTLAQIDPDGDTSRHDSILNLFDQAYAGQGLSAWDKAYLTSLYRAYPERINTYEQASSMARGIRRAEERMEAESHP